MKTAWLFFAASGVSCGLIWQISQKRINSEFTDNCPSVIANNAIVVDGEVDADNVGMAVWGAGTRPWLLWVFTPMLMARPSFATTPRQGKRWRLLEDIDIDTRTAAARGDISATIFERALARI
jgi:hypothetical protein